MLRLSILRCKSVRFCVSRSHSTSEVRVRFAPSPTGFLHLGGLRTALLNYLFAKQHNGRFILRIEDTDQKRLVPGAIDQLRNDLIWTGIEIDEGPQIGGDFGPYLQSQRLGIYKEHVDVLLANGNAYQCFCTDRRLDLLRKEAVKLQQIPKYDNRCRHLSKDEVQKKLKQGLSPCVRFKINSNEEAFDDLIYGRISYNVSVNEGDPVIFKSDGFPTYHFANVIDDHLMAITHVLRGVEWQISTTKHVLLYRAFNWTPPLYGHLPLLMNTDGTKLSKRQGDVKISYYKDNYIFPLAVINFIVNSGGGFAKDSEQNVKARLFTIPELVRQFDLSRISAHSGKLSFERLFEFNRLELKRKLTDSEEENKLVIQLKQLIETTFSDGLTNRNLHISEDYIRYVLNWSVNRIEKLSDLLMPNFEFLWTVPNDYSQISEDELKIIELFTRRFEEECGELNREKLNEFLKKYAKENDIKFGNFMKMLRTILSGLQEGPGVAEIMEILGKSNTLERLRLCLNNNNAKLR